MVQLRFERQHTRHTLWDRTDAAFEFVKPKPPQQGTYFKWEQSSLQAPDLQKLQVRARRQGAQTQTIGFRRKRKRPRGKQSREGNGGPPRRVLVWSNRRITGCLFCFLMRNRQCGSTLVPMNTQVSFENPFADQIR